MEFIQTKNAISNGICTIVKGEETIWSVGPSGKVSRLTSEGDEVFSTNTMGLPMSVAMDSYGEMYVADMEHGAILKWNKEDNTFEAMAAEYEGSSFLGPSSVAESNGSIFFTDSGPLGESNIENRKGSVYRIEYNEFTGQVLKPLALRCLAHPCDICVDGPSVYVAELLMNRILRFSLRPNGAYVMSMLHQFSGRIGPSAIACDKETGYLYVARFEYGSDCPALISILNPTGTDAGHIRDIEVPELESAEVTGLSICQETRTLYVFESNQRGGSIVKMPLD